jgi:hypothetical protein
MPNDNHKVIYRRTPQRVFRTSVGYDTHLVENPALCSDFNAAWTNR